ncbi:MAG: phosphoglycerate mutase family protein [Pseudobdellovibrionaceae bacterium]
MFRHAERENTGSSNPPLSSRGLLQAEKLLEEIDLNVLPRPSKLLSSPKLRAQQTFLQIQNKLGVEIQILSELDERHNFESIENFSKRVKRFLNLMETQNGVQFFVTHLDWIEEALRLIHSDTDLLSERYQSWLPAQSMEFEIHDRLWVLQATRTCLV